MRAIVLPGALTLLDAPGGLKPGTDGVLAVPPALLAGFGDHAVDTVLEELRGLGFAEVVSVHPYEDELRRGVLDLAATSAMPAPVISPVCPAVVSLIEVRCPSLVPHLAPLASPWEALQRDLDPRLGGPSFLARKWLTSAWWAQALPAWARRSNWPSAATR